MWFFVSSFEKKVFLMVLILLVSFGSLSGTANAKFTDVSDRYSESVDYLSANGLVNGISKAQFGVEKQIKRGDAAIILSKALELPENAPSSGFSDVPSRGMEAINALKHAGVVNGKSARNFGFDEPLTRGEIALMLTKASAYDLKGDVKNLSFKDVNNRYLEAVAALVDHQVTSGKTPTRFGTDDKIKRGEFAIFIYRAEMLDKASRDSNVPTETGVAVDKVWTFPFNNKLENSSLTKDKIYVLDQTKSKVDIKISTSNNGQTLVISPPLGNYKKGASYELHIEKGVKYANGQMLAKSIRLDFIIERDEIEKVVLNDEVIVLEAESVTETVEGKLEIDKEQVNDLVTEDIIIVPSVEFPEGQAHKVVSIKDNASSYSVTVEQPDFTELFKELDIYQTYEIKPEHIQLATELDGIRLLENAEARTAATTSALDIDMDEDGLTFEFTDVEIGKGNEKTILNGVFNMTEPDVQTDMELNSAGQVKRYQVIYDSLTSLEMDFSFPEQTYAKDKIIYDKKLKETLKNKKADIKIAKARIPTQVPGLFIQGEFYLQVTYNYSYQPEINVVFRVNESKGVIYDGDTVKSVNNTKPELTISYDGSGVLKTTGGAVANIGLTYYGVAGLGVEGFAGAEGNLEFFHGVNSKAEAYACRIAKFNPILRGSVFVDIVGERVATKQLLEVPLAPYLSEDNCNAFQGLDVKEKNVTLAAGGSKGVSVSGNYLHIGTMETAIKPVGRFADVKVTSSDENTVKVRKETNGITIIANTKPAAGKATVQLEYTEISRFTNKPVKSVTTIPVTISDFMTFDLNGEWSRNSLHNEGQLIINNASSKGFDFELFVTSGAHPGEISGKAKISGNTALFKMEESTCEIKFLLSAASITTSVTSECNGWGGAGTFFDGKFEKGPVSIDTDLVKQGILTGKQDTLFRKVVKEDYSLFLENMQFVSEENDEDYLKAKVLSGFVRGIAPYTETIIMISDQYVYAAVPTENLVNYYTNDPKYKTKIPLTIQKWKEKNWLLKDYQFDYK